MLNKYEDFFKLSKTDQCSIYTAVSRNTGQHVLLKRFKNKLSWDQVLKNRNMQFSQKSKMFPKMIQIFKNKGQFYVVYERPTGQSLRQTDLIGKLSLQDFYIIFDDLCSYVKQLRSLVPGVYLLPEWIFMHRNTIKILHFQPFFLNKDALSSDHVYLYKVQNQIIGSEQQNQSEETIIPAEHKKNIIFNLGMIAYHLLTGAKQIEPESQDDYFNKINQISKNSERQIIKQTKDKQLGQMIGKMLSSNVFDMPDIDKICNLIHVKAVELTPKKRMYSSNIEIELEKIKLEQSQVIQQPQTRRKLRPCCMQKQASIQKINESMKHLRQNKETDRKMINSRIKQQSPRNSFGKKMGTFLPQIKRNKPTTSNRHKTMVDLMNTTNSKPLMFGNRSSFIKS